MKSGSVLLILSSLTLSGCQTVERRGPIVLLTPVGPLLCERHVLTNCGASFYECGPNANVSQLCTSGAITSELKK
jgi:hypothetical protein